MTEKLPKRNYSFKQQMKYFVGQNALIEEN